MSDSTGSVREHYEPTNDDATLVSKVTRILDALEDGSVSVSRLAAFDQFHVRGLAATAELADLASIQGPMKVRMRDRVLEVRRATSPPRTDAR